MSYFPRARVFNIYEVVHYSVGWLRDYVRSVVPPGIHFLLTEYELRLLVLKIMDYRGELDQHSSRILRTPLFGKAYVAEKGNVDNALTRIAVDVLPGATLFRLIP